MVLIFSLFLQPLPYDHAEFFLSNFKDERIFIRKKDDTYPCVVKFSQDQYRLGQGWRDFVIATKLKKHDAVRFTMVYSDAHVTVYTAKFFRANIPE